MVCINDFVSVNDLKILGFEKVEAEVLFNGLSESQDKDIIVEIRYLEGGKQTFFFNEGEYELIFVGDICVIKDRNKKVELPIWLADEVIYKEGVITKDDYMFCFDNKLYNVFI